MKKEWRWVAGIGAAALIFLGGFYLLVHQGVLANPVLYLRGRMSALVIWGGLLVSIVLAGHMFQVTRKNRLHRTKVEDIRAEFRDNRRRFTRRLDHELKNPLTAIRAGLTNITSEPLSEYVEKEVAAVESQALRISRLVADLRKLATLETMQLERTPVNIPELLEEVVGVVREQKDLQEKSLTLITPNAPWPLPVVQGDPDLLLLAVHNLIENALKFTLPEDTIEVRATEEGNQVLIEVADTGHGILEGDLERVWEELYRGSHTHGVEGSGLGLPLVRAIVEKHGGEVSVRSKHEQGSVFSLRLPVRE